jgi:tetratricopeptide (TPR) repeat protein
MRNTGFHASVLLLALLFSLSGCAGFHHPADPEEKIEALIKEHQYDLALAVIAEIPPEHEKYEAVTSRAEEITHMRLQMISGILEEAEGLGTNRDWSGAVAIIGRGLRYFPAEPSLLEAHNRYETMRIKTIRKCELEILMARGRYLAEILQSSENLYQADPKDKATQRHYREFQQNLKETSEKLLTTGREALESNNIRLAIDALTLSNRLTPDEETRALLSGTYRKLWSQREKERSREEIATKNQWPQLEADFKVAIEAGDLVGARRLTRHMTDTDPIKAAAFLEELERQINRKAGALDARGRLLYEEGFIEEALQLWQEALQLKPNDPELLQNVHRAATFLKNIDRWRE